MNTIFFLFQIHPSPNVLYVQVGNGTEDHRFWGRPEDWNGSNPRPTLKATPTKPGVLLKAKFCNSKTANALILIVIY